MLKRDCDIIIPVFDQLKLTQDCFKSIENNTHIPYNLIVIDNASGKGTKEFLKVFASSRSNVKVVENRENLGWIKAVNQGLRLSDSPYMCIMNNDTVVRTDGWIFDMIAIAESEGDIGLVNPRFEIKKEASSGRPFTEIDFCRGYCVLIKRAVMEKIGVLDEAYGLGYYDDDDYSVRAINAGYRCVRANNVIVEHLRDSTFSAVFESSKRMALHEANKKLFYSKWGRRLKLLFMVTKDTDHVRASSLFLKLARKQHVIDVWNFTDPLRLDHTSIRERMLPSAISGMAVPVAFFMESTKKRSRRHDMIFPDTAGEKMDSLEKKVLAASRA